MAPVVIVSRKETYVNEKEKEKGRESQSEL